MVVQFSGRLPALETVRLEDRSAGLDGVIVVHSTTLGPGAGGCANHALPQPPFHETLPPWQQALEETMRLLRIALVGLTLLMPDAATVIGHEGPHGLSRLIYAYASAAGNNE